MLTGLAAGGDLRFLFFPLLLFLLPDLLDQRGQRSQG
jgi:hypothetical protein